MSRFVPLLPKIIAGVLSLNPAPENTKSKDTVYPNIPIDPNYIFGNVQTTKSPFFSHQPYPPPQPGLGSLPSVFQPMYPPLNQPPPGAQVPIAFGASPQNPYYPPRPQNPATSTEPSLWNQFLYNKQPDKRPRNGAALPSLRSSSLATVLLASAAVLLTNIQRHRGQNSNTDLYSNTPDRPKPGASAPSDDDVLASLGLNPSQPIPNNRPSGNNNGGHNPYQNPYPTLPPRQPAQPAQPQYPGGGNNYYGGGGGGGTGGSSHYGGNRGQFDGAGGNIVVPSPKPPTPAGGGGGGFFSGIFGGIQNAVSNAVKQQVGTYINQRLGIGPAAGGQAGGAGGLGGLLDARNFIDQKKFGGLFAEKPAAGNSGSSGSGSTSGTSGGNPYPVTVDQRPIQSVVGQQQYASRSSEQSSQYGQRKPQQQGTPAPYGWKLD
ncbi:hypothetical protein pipiens_015218 [Culex pipiens pipiens]|uniref:Uncharacterized protein n=1 Tax=Culex pipiens pipiens TaxID=38569 RepID=A0ABD1CRE9_CULPP